MGWREKPKAWSLNSWRTEENKLLFTVCEIVIADFDTRQKGELSEN